VLEVPAPVDGTVRELRAQEGDTVNSDDVIAVIEEGDIEAAEAGEAPAMEDAPAVAEAQTAEAPRLSPAARRVAEEEKVDPSQVEGTGRGGRVTKGDVVNFVRSGGSRQEERVKMTRLRSRIAERMKDAQNTAAILTSFNEVDLKAVMDLRRKYQDAFTTRHGIKLGLMSFFVKACCEALRKHPVVNASMDGD
jgi:2-oxoglutarate dehydrogenase E2 component (dihydrolipoamide succinyltransferase)